MVDRWRRRTSWRDGLIGLAALLPIMTSSATPTATTAPPACTRPAMIVLDGSGSMMATKDGESRLQSAKRALQQIAVPVSALRPVGLIVYSGNFSVCDNVRMLVPPRLESGPALVAALADVQPSGATPLGAAVRRAVGYFRDRAEPATVVVVTDGEENCGDYICGLAEEIREIRPRLDVHVIGYSLLDRQAQTMRCLASRNHGRYVTVDNAAALADALQAALGCPAVSRGPGEAVQMAFARHRPLP